VHVDYCAKCHGVFLDRGELDAAVAAVKGSTLRQVITLAAHIAG
jgi:Zn-finger nucleic acid-binding protein